METKSSSSEYKLNEVLLIQFSLRPVQGIAVHPVLSYFMAFCLCHNTAYNIQVNQIKDCACNLTVTDGSFYPDLKALQFEFLKAVAKHAFQCSAPAIQYLLLKTIFNSDSATVCKVYSDDTHLLQGFVSFFSVTYCPTLL